MIVVGGLFLAGLDSLVLGISRRNKVTNTIFASLFASTQQSGAAGSEGGSSQAPVNGVPSEGVPQGAPGPMGCGKGAGGGGGSSMLIMMGVMFVALYFLMIRPQQKKAKEHQSMIDSIKKGTEVITNGGLNFMTLL